MHRRVLTLLALLALALPAQAAHDTQILFLEDGEYGAAGDGRLVAEMPADDEAAARVVVPGEASFQTNRFILEDVPAQQVKGRLVAGLWTDQLPVVEGQFQAVLFRVDNSGMHELATAQVAVARDAPAPPDPATLVGDPAANPEAAAWQAVAQANALVRAPPILVDFGAVDVTLGADDRLALGFRMADGTVAPLAIEYGARIAPSFLVLPLHEAAPAASASVPPSVVPGAGGDGDDGAGDGGADDGAGGGGGGGDGGDDEDNGDNGIPGPAFLLVLAAVGLAVGLRRRRA